MILIIFRPPSTPNKTDSVTCPDTERSIRTNGGSQLATKRRSNIKTEMEFEFIGCSYDKFLNNYSPFKPPPTEVEACIEHLLTVCAKVDTLPETILKKVNIDGRDHVRITKFHDTQHSSEQATFAHMDGITQGIAKYSFAGRGSIFSYLDCPRTALESDIGGSNHLIDGAFVFRPPIDNKIDTSNVAVCAEYKIKNTPYNRLDVSCCFTCIGFV